MQLFTIVITDHYGWRVSYYCAIIINLACASSLMKPVDICYFNFHINAALIP